MSKGKLIVIEGMDGSGKTTACVGISNWLSQNSWVGPSVAKNHKTFGEIDIDNPTHSNAYDVDAPASQYHVTKEIHQTVQFNDDFLSGINLLRAIFK